MTEEIWIAVIGAIGVIGAAVLGCFSSINGKERSRKTRKAKQNMVLFGPRSKLDTPLNKKLNTGLGIEEIRAAGFACTSIVSPEMVDFSSTYSKNDFSSKIKSLVETEQVKLRLIIMAPDSAAAQEAINNGKIQNKNAVDKMQCFYLAYADICKSIQPGGVFYDSYKKYDFLYRVTDISLPYAIFQVKYKDGKNDYIKLDLYSPYIPWEDNRRSIVIFKSDDPEDYQFFDEHYNHIFNNAKLPSSEQDKVWRKKAEDFTQQLH